MRLMTLRCPACGGLYDGRIAGRFVTCEYCGSRFGFDEAELRGLGFGDEDEETAEWEDFDDEEESELSIPDYAHQLCDEFLDEHASERKHFRSSRKILNGLEIPHSDEVYLIHDDTFLQSGKNGFAITSSGIYCRDMGEGESHFVDWAKFAKGKRPAIDSSYIKQRGTSIAYYTDGEYCRDELLELFKRLHRHAQTMQG